MKQILVCQHIESQRAESERFRASVKIEGNEIRGRSLFDRLLFRRRKLGLKLIGDGFGDLALNGKDVRKIAIISLRPEMRVVAGIDQLRVHPHAIARRVARCLRPSARRRVAAPISRRLRCVPSCTA